MDTLQRAREHSIIGDCLLFKSESRKQRPKLMRLGHGNAWSVSPTKKICPSEYAFLIKQNIGDFVKSSSTIYLCAVERKQYCVLLKVR